MRSDIYGHVYSGTARDGSVLKVVPAMSGLIKASVTPPEDVQQSAHNDTVDISDFMRKRETREHVPWFSLSRKWVIVSLVAVALAGAAGTSMRVYSLVSKDNQTSRGGTSNNQWPCDQVTPSKWSILFPGSSMSAPVYLDDRCEVSIASAETGTPNVTIGRLRQDYDTRLASAVKDGNRTSQLSGVGERAFYNSSDLYAEVAFVRHGKAYFVFAWYGVTNSKPNEAALRGALFEIASVWQAKL
jgi:hypothetical protein